MKIKWCNNGNCGNCLILICIVHNFVYHFHETIPFCILTNAHKILILFSFLFIYYRSSDTFTLITFYHVRLRRKFQLQTVLIRTWVSLEQILIRNIKFNVISINSFFFLIYNVRDLFLWTLFLECIFIKNLVYENCNLVNSIFQV